MSGQRNGSAARKAGCIQLHTEEVLVAAPTSQSLCDISDEAVLGRQGHTAVAAELLVQSCYAQLAHAGHLQLLHTLYTIGKTPADIRASSLMHPHSCIILTIGLASSLQ